MKYVKMRIVSFVKMKRSKIIFLVLAVLFLIFIIIASYDIGKKTAAPWEDSHMKKELQEISQ